MARRNRVRIDMTPMVDVAFLLLIFFMSTTQFKPPEQVAVDLPLSRSEIHVPETGTIILTVNRTGQIFISSELGRDIQELFTARNVLMASVAGTSMAAGVLGYWEQDEDVIPDSLGIVGLLTCSLLGVSLFLAIVLELAIPIIVIERRSALGALRRGWDLVRRRFWWVLGFFMVIYLLQALIVTGPGTLAQDTSTTTQSAASMPVANEPAGASTTADGAENISAASTEPAGSIAEQTQPAAEVEELARLEPAGIAAPEPAGSEPLADVVRPGSTGRWVINLASYAGPRTADRMQRKFEGLGVSTEKQVAEVNGKTMYRLRIASFQSRADAEAYFETIKGALGLESAWITKK